jgi:hypothetical protein
VTWPRQLAKRTVARGTVEATLALSFWMRRALRARGCGSGTTSRSLPQWQPSMNTSTGGTEDDDGATLPAAERRELPVELPVWPWRGRIERDEAGSSETSNCPQFQGS